MFTLVNLQPYTLAVQNLFSLAGVRASFIPADRFVAAALDVRAALEPEFIAGIPEERLEKLGLLIASVSSFRVAENLSVEVARAFVDHLQGLDFLPGGERSEADIAAQMQRLLAPPVPEKAAVEGAQEVYEHRKTIIGWGHLHLKSALAAGGVGEDEDDERPTHRRTMLEDPASPPALQPPDLPRPRPKTVVLDSQTGKVVEPGFLWIKGDVDNENGDAEERNVRSPYKIQGLVGRGGNGYVYRAVEEGTNRVVAVKILALPAPSQNDPAGRRQRLLEREAALHRFEKERELQGGLTSDRIVRVFNTGRTAAGDPFIAMEFVGGGTLHEWIWRRLRDGRPFDIRQAVSFAAQAASAVRDANRAGIIHRDIKPDNCLLTDEGRLKLSDFGIAKREAEPAPDPEEVGLAGTLGFMSPERLTADAGLLAKFPYRDDVFALGALLYEALTGRNPFYLYEDDQGRPLPPDVYANKNAVWPLQLRSIQYDPPAPSAVRPNHGITENLDRIALKALSKDPADRHEDVQAFLDDLVTHAAQDLEKTAAAFLAETPPTHTEETIRRDAWRENMQRALGDYRRVHDEYPSERLRDRMVTINRDLHDWADRRGDDESVRRTGDRILELAPSGPHSERVSRPIGVRFELDGKLPKGATPRFTLARFVNRAGFLESAGVGKSGPDLPEGEVSLQRGFAYALRFECPGVAPVNIPLPVRPGSYRIRIPVYPASRIPAGFVVIPAGPAAARENPGSFSELFENWRTVNHDFAAAPLITNLQWWSRLHRIYKAMGAQAALERMPRHWKMDDQGRFTLMNGQAIAPGAPVTHMPIESALEFLKDWGQELGVSLRAPTLNEWKRLLRGNDARPWPWGNAAPEFGVAGFRYSDPRAHGAVVALPNDAPGLKDISPFSLRAAAGSSEERLLAHVAGNVQKFLDFGTSRERHLISKALGISEETLTSDFYLVAGASYEGPAPIDLDILQYKPRTEAGAVGIMPILQLDKADPTPTIESLIRPA